MKPRTLGRHVGEGIKSLGRNGWMSFAAVSAVTVTLLILGLFLLLALNVNHMADMIEDEVQIRVAVSFDATEADIQSTESRLNAIPEVSNVHFIPKSEGFEQLKEDLGDSDLLEGAQADWLPDVFMVKTADPRDVQTVTAQIDTFDHVESAEYGEDYADQLFSWTQTIRNVGIVFIVLLGLTAMFLISNTIRLTIVARRREIEIMKLVGATNWFIRWPFFVEGLLIGLIGAVIPAGLLILGYYNLTANMGAFGPWFLNLLPATPLAFQVGLVLGGIGVFIGTVGSFLSVHRFLKI